MFIFTFSIGLIIGLIVYSLTYLFVKDIDNLKRAIIVLGIGILFLIGSLTIIGGFEAIPYGIVSVGIILVAAMFALFGRNLLWKKVIYTLVILFSVSYLLFTNLNEVNYWIVKKTHYPYLDDVRSYMQQIQRDTAIEGYKTFTITEGNKGVVLSLGGEKAGNNIEVIDVKEYYGTTEIKIRTFYNQSGEENPVIMIGLGRLQDEIIIMDTDGTIYEEATIQ